TKPHDKINKLHTRNGHGEVYYTNLICKLLCLVANKVASLEPRCIRLEMEGSSANWYDALNGLPGLLGSSISETLELKRLCLFLLNAFRQLSLKDHVAFSIFKDVADFILALNGLANEENPLTYWQRANDIKEHYRFNVLHGI